MQIVDTSHTYKYDINSNIDLDKTFNCGQCFRWNKLGDFWVGVVRNKVYAIKKVDNTLITTATPDEFNYLRDYLDLDADYTIEIPDTDRFALESAKFGNGIRILKQEPWEMLISYIISQRNNIPKIKSTIEKLCKAFGKELDIQDVNGNKYNHKFYGFPSVDELSVLNTDDLHDIGLGYRDEYIIKAAKEVASGRLKLESLLDNKVSGDEAVNILLSLRGVGPKVANCVALFGLHKLDMFPIDVWIQRVIDTYYNGSIDISHYGNMAGVVQQYMFYYIKYSDNIIS